MMYVSRQAPCGSEDQIAGKEQLFVEDLQQMMLTYTLALDDLSIQSISL